MGCSCGGKGCSEKECNCENERCPNCNGCKKCGSCKCN